MKRILIPTTLGLLLFLVHSPLYAQISTDGTLSARTTLSGPNYSIDAVLGQQAGNNLFHSFSDFNINTGESATFNGPASIQNVISRVTGGNPSNIDGLLRSNMPNADVYLLNPSGLMFGPNATLNVPAAFHASTADHVRLQDGTQFGVQTGNGALLSASPVVAFGFLDAPAAIQVKGSNLRSDNGTLGLSGGDISISDAILASRQQIYVASLGSAGEIVPNVDSITLNGDGGNVQMQGARISAANPSGSGNIYIHSGRFSSIDTRIDGESISGDSGRIVLHTSGDATLNNSVVTNLTSGSGNGGDIDVMTGGTLQLNKSAITASTFSKQPTAGNGGNIHIRSATVKLIADSQITSDTLGEGAGGNIEVNADGDVTLQASNITVSSGNVPGGDNTGQAGTLMIAAKNVTLDEGASIAANTLGSGAGGNIRIQAAGNIVVQGERFVSTGQENEQPRRIGSLMSVSSRGGDGNAGSMQLNASNIFIQKGGVLFSVTFGNGNGGEVLLSATDSIILDSGASASATGIVSNSAGEGSKSGDAGQIHLSAPTIVITRGAFISSTTQGVGHGGDVILEGQTVTMDGQSTNGDGSVVLAETLASGAGGQISVKTGTLTMRDAAQISATTKASGHGGNVTVIAGGEVTINGQDSKGFRSGLFASSESEAADAGVGGTINLSADTIRLENGARIAVETNGADGGILNINVPNYIYLLNGSNLTASVNQQGNGGNITVNGDFVVLNRSSIIAQAVFGNGGDIDIVTKGLYIFTPEAESVISASSKFGLAGTVEVRSPEGEADEANIVLDSNYDNAEVLLQSLCNLRAGKGASHFLVIPMSGSQETPDSWQVSALLPLDSTQIAQAADGTAADEQAAPIFANGRPVQVAMVNCGKLPDKLVKS